MHTFTDSRTAYNQTQYRNDVHNGDVVHIPSEDTAGFLMQAWPVAVSRNCGELQTLADPTNYVIDGFDYATSARIARILVSETDTPAQYALPSTATVTRGLVPAQGVWTVTIAGSERHVMTVS